MIKEVVCMFKYVKHLNYPINIKKKDLKMAKCLITQFGGSNGELAASLRYFSQKFSSRRIKSSWIRKYLC